MKIFEIYQEEEDSSFTHNGKKYLLNPLLRYVSRNPVVNVPLSKVKWVLDYCRPDPQRIRSADTNAPIIIVNDGTTYTVVDGLHRLAKAVANGDATILSKIISDDELELFSIEE